MAKDIPLGEDRMHDDKDVDGSKPVDGRVVGDNKNLEKLSSQMYGIKWLENYILQLQLFWAFTGINMNV